MKCKHENADHLMAGNYYSNGKPFQTIVVACEQFRCLDCGAWLSLGPAKDDERTAVEARAAEIATDWRDLRQSQLSSELRQICNGAEIAGWIEARFDSAKVPEQDGEWAGWLAQIIDDHDKEQGNG